MTVDEEYMRLALQEAQLAYEEGEVPIGAVVVCQGKVIAQCHNQVEKRKLGMAHAELLALEEASSVLKAWRLDDCTLYVTKEPCPMCTGAMVNCRLKRVVFGCSDPRTGGAGGCLDIAHLPEAIHTVEVTPNILEEECRSLIQQFFRMRRGQKI